MRRSLGFTLGHGWEGQFKLDFPPRGPHEIAALLATPTFGPSFGLRLSTVPSADFSYDPFSPDSRTRRRSPEVRTTAFAARPPDLPPRSLMTMDFAITCSLVRPGRPRYPVLVHRAAALLLASFRPNLAMTPLRFANPSPSSGWIKDLHLQAVVHARHTRKSPAGAGLHVTISHYKEGVAAQGVLKAANVAAVLTSNTASSHNSDRFPGLCRIWPNPIPCPWRIWAHP
jgi:hypothetical protein